MKKFLFLCTMLFGVFSMGNCIDGPPGDTDQLIIEQLSDQITMPVAILMDNQSVVTFQVIVLPEVFKSYTYCMINERMVLTKWPMINAVCLYNNTNNTQHFLIVKRKSETTLSINVKTRNITKEVLGTGVLT